MSWYIRNGTIRGFSDAIAGRFASWTSANQISIARLPLAIMIAVLIGVQWLFAAGILYAIAAGLDFLDGAVARYQDERGMKPGLTETGKWLDPFADKIVNQITLFALGWNYLPHVLLYACLSTAVLLTALRPLKKWLSLGDGRANGFGKIKMIIEVTLILLLFFQPKDFAATIPHLLLALVLLTCAIGFALLSFSFHLMPPKNKTPSCEGSMPVL